MRIQEKAEPVRGRTTSPAVRSPAAPARERILAASMGLFAARGIGDVGVDELILASGVAKATFYRHFPSKEALALACLERWHRERGDAIARAALRGGEAAVLAVFDVFDVFEGWLRDGWAEAGSILHVMMEMGPGHPLGKASIDYLRRTRLQFAGLTREAGLGDAEDFAWSLDILLNGSVVAAAQGDPHAAERAREMAALLIQHHRGIPFVHQEPRVESNTGS